MSAKSTAGMEQGDDWPPGPTESVQSPSGDGDNDTSNVGAVKGANGKDQHGPSKR